MNFNFGKTYCDYALSGSKLRVFGRIAKAHDFQR
jgi:hypothetical protein